MARLRVVAKKLNKRNKIPFFLPDPDGIIGVVNEHFTFDGEEIIDVPNPALGKWYRDKNGHFYWEGGVNEIDLLSETFEEALVEAARDEEASIGWGLRKLLIKDFWQAAGNKGDDVTIAILDTGISSTHPEFDFTKITRFNVLNGDAVAEDTSGHGSHVAGIIGAQGRQVMGTAPKANLLVIKIAESSDSWEIANVVKGIQHAIDSKADIISFSGEFSELDADLEILRKKVEEASGKGIITIASAGNNFNDFPVESFPAAFDPCISVGSIKQDGLRADSSSHSTKLDVVAPGQDILSTWTGSNYRVESGTSMATPMVAGIVAVIKSFAKTKLNRMLTPSEIQVMLNKSADEAGDNGFDTSYGFGIVNPNEALKILRT